MVDTVRSCEVTTVGWKSLVTDFPAVGFLSLIGIYFGFESWVLWFTLLFLHLTSAVERVKLVCGQKYLLIIATGIVIRLDVNDSELSGVQSTVEIASGHHVGVHPANPGRLRRELIADLPTRRNNDAPLFPSAIDFRRNELTMPMTRSAGTR